MKSYPLIKKLFQFLILIALVSPFLSCGSPENISTADNTEQSNENENPDDTENQEPETPNESSDSFEKYYKTNDSIFQLNSIIQLDDASYIIAGGVRYNGSYNKNTILKFNEYGNRIWTKVMTESYTPNGIEKLFKNGEGFVGYRGSYYADDQYDLIYFDSEGNFENQYETNIDIEGYDAIRNGYNFVIVGRNSGLVIKEMSPTGDVVWSNTIESANAGGNTIVELTDGNYITIGGANVGTAGDNLIKISSSGEELWSKTYNGYKIMALPDNEFLAITGASGLTVPDQLVKFDENGTELWSVILEDFIYSLDTVGLFRFGTNLVCTYGTYNNGLAIKVFDETGAELKTIYVDDEDSVYYRAVSKTQDNGLIIATEGYIFDFKLIKLSNEDLFN